MKEAVVKYNNNTPSNKNNKKQIYFINNIKNVLPITV